MKKTMQLMWIVIMSMILLSSCVSNGDSGEREDLVVLTVAVRSGESRLLQSVWDQYESENKDIQLKFVELSSEFDQYSYLSSAFSSGEYLFDIVETEDTWIDDFIDKQWIVPIGNSTLIDDEYFDYVKDSFVREDKTYAMPLHMDLGMLYSLEKYDWDGEYSSISNYSENTDNGLKINDNREDIICALMELVEYTDGDVNTALELYRVIYNTSNDERMNIDAFKKGDIPIMHSWSSVISELNEESSQVSAIFEAHNTPLSKNGRETSVAKLFGLSVSSLSEHKEECKRVIEFFGRDDVQVGLIKESGMYPLKQKLYSDYTVVSAWNHISKMENRVQDINLRPHIKNYAQTAMDIRNDVLDFAESKNTVDTTAEDIKKFFRGDL